jgi:hypothetical protein
MTDTTRLAELLAAYDGAVERHLHLLADEFAHLQRSWWMLRECYEGTGADRFDAVWTGTERRFEDYQEKALALQLVLRDRLEALRRHDRPDV